MNGRLFCGPQSCFAGRNHAKYSRGEHSTAMCPIHPHSAEPAPRRDGCSCRAIFLGGTAMRRLLMIAASAAALSLSAAGAGAAAMNDAGVRALADRIGVTDQVRRVCREVCREGFCRQRCWNDDNYGYRERRVIREYDDDYAPRTYYRDRPRGPGVGIYGPGVGVEVGPGW